MEVKPENLLSVSVGRVVSRKVDVSGFVTPPEYEQYFSSAPTLESVTLPDDLKNDWLLVPNIYANLYLGEVFSFYISFTNDSIQDAMTNVTIRIDIQIGNKAILLKEIKADSLDVKASLETILSHEIKEPSIHVLICTLGFNISGHERQTCRKFYQFQISKPIDVKTKFYYTESDEIYLEALFQNLTNLPIQLRNVSFESANYDVASLNYHLDSPQKWIFGELNRLNPMELRQYLFLLNPKKEIRFNAAVLRSITTIGKLDIVWISAIGEKGHIQTSQLEKSNSSCDNIKILVEDIPTQVQLKKIFKVKFRLVNCSSQAVDPVIDVINSKNPQILYLGLSSRSVGQLQELQDIAFELSLYPVQKGSHVIPPIKVRDLLSARDYQQEYKELAFVDVI